MPSKTLIRAAASLAALAVPLSLGVPAPSTALPAAAPATAAMQRVTFVVDGCDGCRLTLIHTLHRYPEHGAVFQTAKHEVVDGRVSWRVPAADLKGLVATVDAPWDGHLGYVTEVVFRYAGEKPGDSVGVHRARQKDAGTVCLDDSDPATVHLRITKVRVPGVHGPTTGTLAFASTTTPSLPSDAGVRNGVAGTQDVPLCDPRS